jgi:hypothetical protein
MKGVAMEILYPGRYRHYKGKNYEVIGEATHSETMEELVVYRALYGAYGLWVRPKAMFLEPVIVGEKTVFRFEPIIVIQKCCETGDKQQGNFQQFEIPSREPLSVMTLLAKVHEQDEAYAYLTSTCFKEKGGSYLVKVNGQEIDDNEKLVNPGETVSIVPSQSKK